MKEAEASFIQDMKCSARQHGSRRQWIHPGKIENPSYLIIWRWPWCGCLFISPPCDWILSWDMNPTPLNVTSLPLIIIMVRRQRVHVHCKKNKQTHISKSQSLGQLLRVHRARTMGLKIAAKMFLLGLEPGLRSLAMGKDLRAQVPAWAAVSILLFLTP